MAHGPSVHTCVIVVYTIQQSCNLWLSYNQSETSIWVVMDLGGRVMYDVRACVCVCVCVCVASTGGCNALAEMAVKRELIFNCKLLTNASTKIVML
jgi:hypothetical protein